MEVHDAGKTFLEQVWLGYFNAILQRHFYHGGRYEMEVHNAGKSFWEGLIRLGQVDPHTAPVVESLGTSFEKNFDCQTI